MPAVRVPRGLRVSQLEVGAWPGQVPVGAKLRLTGNHPPQGEPWGGWLEMEGTHELNGFPVHPLTLSLDAEDHAKVSAAGAERVWRLVSHDGNGICIVEPVDIGQDCG